MNPTHTSPKVNWLQRLASSRFFVISAALHGFVLILLGGMMVSSKEIKSVAERSEWVVILPPDLENEFSVETSLGAKPGENPPVEPPAPPARTERLRWIEEDDEPGFRAYNIDVIVCHFPELSDQPNLGIPCESFPAFELNPATLPESLRARVGLGRKQAMLKMGMKDSAELAVLKSLEWLRLNQNADGSWGETYKGSVTGLALLCFLGHGETDRSPQYGLTVSKAADWLRMNGTKLGGRLQSRTEFEKSINAREHGISTYALAEYFTLTKDERVIELLRQAVGHIVEGQSERGGWNHHFDKREDEMSLSGWMVQALAAAQKTGLQIPEVEGALDKAMECIDRRWRAENDEDARRDRSFPRSSATGAGVMGKLLWKGTRGEVTRGMDYLLNEKEGFRPVKFGVDYADFDTWYYSTYAAALFGGSAWQKWNRSYQDVMVQAQLPDGSWPAPVQHPAYMNAQDLSARTARTAMCALMLEAFYRYTVSNATL